MESVHVVWFKRDLRIRDHMPLVQAAARGRVLPLYVFEPEMWHQPEMDQTHFDFVCQSLRELDHRLNPYGLRMHLRVGTMIEVLEDLRHRYGIAAVYSHEEVGGRWSYDRDRQVRGWLASHGIEWTEIPQNGVVRGLWNRDRWAAQWKDWMNRSQAPSLEGPCLGVPPDGASRFPSPSELHLRPTQGTACQVGGESRADELLESFLRQRATLYRSAMSSPQTAEEHCSRLSPYIAWGCITIKRIHQSVREAQHAIEHRRAEGLPFDRSFAQSLSSFQSRLSWHCHFIQKLEDEPELEFRNMCRAYDGMREDAFRQDYFEAWCQGTTGYPMIDACMRYLHHHRWINFRMRAMLMSFAAYHLWLHWREPALFLARHFLDFEPGIHFPQAQMQSGVTGINTIRIYSPVKQAMDQDPDGAFVRRWVPELEHVPTSAIFQPWMMGQDDQRRYRCRIGEDYPTPIVDHREAVAAAKDRIYTLRQTDLAVSTAQKVYEKHGSRKNRDPLPKKKSIPPASTQPWLPGMDQS